ncbi:hypothetical protein [Prosthecobacter sp.]|uniref:hypothetical protein n=1 Tax=Prosthecobacter sp. TaxID=1965333 RepID=UPI003782DEA8
MKLASALRSLRWMPAFFIWTTLCGAKATASDGFWHVQGHAASGTYNAVNQVSQLQGFAVMSDTGMQFASTQTSFSIPEPLEFNGSEYNYFKKDVEVDESTGATIIKKSTRLKITVIDANTMLLVYGVANYLGGDPRQHFTSFEWTTAVLTADPVPVQVQPLTSHPAWNGKYYPSAQPGLQENNFANGIMPEAGNEGNVQFVKAGSTGYELFDLWGSFFIPLESYGVLKDLAVDTDANMLWDNPLKDNTGAIKGYERAFNRSRSEESSYVYLGDGRILQTRVNSTLADSTVVLLVGQSPPPVPILADSDVYCVLWNPETPVVSLMPISNLTVSGVTLNGRVNTNGFTATVQFEHGLTTDYGNTATATLASEESTLEQAVSSTLSELDPGTLYHYRLKLTYAGGEVTTGDATFTTLVPKPEAAIKAASGMTATTATLNGTVNPKGFVTTALFEYGLTSGYGSTVPAVLSPDNSKTVQTVSALITNLLPGTQYYFRLRATNAGGTSTTIDGNFTTLMQVPIVIFDQAEEVTSTGGSLKGKVNPNGLETTVQVLYGVTTQYGSTLNVPLAVNNSTTAQDVDILFENLFPGTTYYYLLTTTNSGGATSHPGTFTTLTLLQQWRWNHFRTTGNAGQAADALDFDQDGIPNLMEFALLLDPTKTSVLPATHMRNGNVYEYVYTRSTSARNSGVSFEVEWSETPDVSSSWSSLGVVEQILSSNATMQQVKATIPIGGSGRLFARLKVTAPLLIK